MSLTAEFKAAVVAILDAFDDLIVDVAFHRITPGVYNPAMNAVAVTDVTTTVRGAFYNETEESKDWEKPNANSVYFVVSGDELGFVPTEKDFFVDPNSKRWDIIKIDTLTNNIAHIMKVRAP